jgi:AcrR family transcriptional regulator
MAMVAKSKSKLKRDARPQVTKGAGRPRAVTLDNILDAAIELGLASITMAGIAAKLGVGTATIYNYASRDEIVRLAALRLARRPRLDDLGEHWSDVVRRHAEYLFEFLLAEPQIAIQYMQGTIGPETQLDHLECFLAALARRGFSISEGYQIFSAMNDVVFGAVLRGAHVRAMRAKAYGHEGAVRRSLAERGLSELPHVRACEDFCDETRAFTFMATINRIIRSVESERAAQSSNTETRSAGHGDSRSDS